MRLGQVAVQVESRLLSLNDTAFLLFSQQHPGLVIECSTRRCFDNAQILQWHKNGEDRRVVHCVVLVDDWCTLVPQHSSILPNHSLVFYTFRCVNYGVLPAKKAAKLHAIVTDRKKKQRVGGMQTSSSSAPPKKKKAKIVKEEAVDTELQLPGGEGIASANL